MNRGTLEEPLISLIVPTFNRQQQLRVCLDALSALDYPRERFEVIIVDDGSSAPLDSVIPSVSGLNVNLIRQEHAGPAQARNRGAAIARGRLLAFTDDDCVPDTKWLARLEQAHRALPGHMIGGKIVNACLGNVYSEASQELITYLYAYYESLGHPRLLVTSNVGIPAQAFRDVGGFQTRFLRPAGEDREFCDRWLHRGFGMTYAPDAIVHHYHSLGLATFVRQHMNYGRAAFHVHNFRAERGEMFALEPLSFYLNMLRYPFGRRSSLQAVVLSGLFTVAQTANATGFFLEVLAARGRGRT